MPTLQMAQARRRVGLLLRDVRASAVQSSAGERGVAGGAAYAIRWGMGFGLHRLCVVLLDHRHRGCWIIVSWMLLIGS